MTRLLSRPWPAALALGALAQALFCWRLTIPHTLLFDETHYVPAARTLRALAEPANVEHPLLGKTIIAIGMMIFGDNALGWRAFSTIAATAVVMGVFAILQLTFRLVRTSVLGALLALVNFTVFVQARIAMLDGFMAAFVAVKRGWPQAWPGLDWFRAWTLLGVGTAGAYVATFAPAFFYRSNALTWRTFASYHADMYARQTQVLPAHTYQSSWWTWALDLRPIWYLYEPVDGAQRGVLMLGNPVVLWGGLVAVAACLWAWARYRDAKLGAVAALWIGSYAVWAIIPKSLGFFYYYYLPSIWLAVVIAAAAHRFARERAWDEAVLLVAAGLFVWFHPILSAAPLSGPQAFQRWMWFDRWM